jgi:hypothetical protein
MAVLLSVEQEILMSRAALFLAILIISLPSVSAQQLGRPQDGFYSGAMERPIFRAMERPS